MTVQEKAVSDCSSNQDGRPMDLVIQPTTLLCHETARKATSAELRSALGAAFECRVHDWLTANENILAVAPFGVETIFPPEFCKVIRLNGSDSVREFSCSPDFVCIRKNRSVVFVEAKQSRTIERTAWTAYTGLDQRTPVWLIVEVDGKAYMQRISHVLFQDSELYTQHYKDPFAISEDGWITSGRNAERSGKPYRAIDLTSMIPLDLGARNDH